MKCLVYTQYGGNVSSFCPPWMTKIINKFLHSVLFIIRMGSEFSLFGATRLEASKTDPAEIESICKSS